MTHSGPYSWVPMEKLHSSTEDGCSALQTGTRRTLFRSLSPEPRPEECLPACSLPGGDPSRSDCAGPHCSWHRGGGLVQSRIPLDWLWEASGHQRKPTGFFMFPRLCMCACTLTQASCDPWTETGLRPRPSPTGALSEASLFAVWSGKIPPQLMIHWAPPLRLWAWKETATFSTV